MARLRQRVSKGLRHWEDDRLLALVNWHLAVAFDRAGPRGFRRHLPPSLAGLTDEDLAGLVDWERLRALEHSLWEGNDQQAGEVSRGASHLASWWNRLRALQQAARRAGTTPQSPDSNPTQRWVAEASHL